MSPPYHPPQLGSQSPRCKGFQDTPSPIQQWPYRARLATPRVAPYDSKPCARKPPPECLEQKGRRPSQEFRKSNWQSPALMSAVPWLHQYMRRNEQGWNRENLPSKEYQASPLGKPTKEPVQAHSKPAANWPSRLSRPDPWATPHGKRVSQSTPLLQPARVGCRFLSNTIACPAMHNDPAWICHRENHSVEKSL